MSWLCALTFPINVGTGSRPTPVKQAACHTAEGSVIEPDGCQRPEKRRTHIMQTRRDIILYNMCTLFQKGRLSVLSTGGSGSGAAAGGKMCEEYH
eukprot:5706213-Pyramimonas_sp.AAC.2